jgi:hypothetical protein
MAKARDNTIIMENIYGLCCVLGEILSIYHMVAP